METNTSAYPLRLTGELSIVRAVLLPATMKLLGDWNWYLPSWLQWLPRLEHERPAEPRLKPQPEILAA
jgi:putative drug exporter of the RND superfamily